MIAVTIEEQHTWRDFFTRMRERAKDIVRIGTPAQLDRPSDIGVCRLLEKVPTAVHSARMAVEADFLTMRWERNDRQPRSYRSAIASKRAVSWNVALRVTDDLHEYICFGVANRSLARLQVF